MKAARKHSRDNRPPSYKQYARLLRKHKNDLYERYSVKEIGIFGSYIRGEQKRRSDLDVLVDFEEIPGLLKFINLENYLSRILKKKVDLVDKQGLRPQLRDHILNEVIYV